MVQVTGLYKRYGTFEALKGVSFEAHEGQIMGFLGPNGAGKTTTLNIMAGYISATEGNVLINGADIFEQPFEAKRHLGYLPEQPPLYLDMTVETYLSFVWELKNCKLPKKEHIAQVCEKTGISQVQHRRLKNLSKGYRQRTGLAQALIGYPPVLLLDEPTSGLDPVQIIEIRNLIKELGQNHTIILSSHILPEVQMLCDHVVVIDHGKVVANGTPEDLSRSLSTSDSVLARIKAPENDLVSSVRGLEGVGEAILLPAVEAGAVDIEIRAASDIRAALFDLCAGKGWQILELKRASASLEDIFIRLVTKEEQNWEGSADEGNFQA